MHASGERLLGEKNMYVLIASHWLSLFHH